MIDISGAPAMKTEHLVTYDYRQGGVWAFVLAASPEEITRRYPGLQIVDAKPGWMTADVENRIRSTLTIDIDDAANPFFQALAKQRGDGGAG
jgi:hypothetical protein